MITPALVRGQVVDIRKASPVPTDLVVDANVLYWLFYPNFQSLTFARGASATPFRLANYQSFWKRAARAGARFCVVNATLGEFARTAEFAELEAIWLTDSPGPQPDPANPVAEFNPRLCKFARYHYAAQLRTVRNSIDGMMGAILKSVRLLPQFATADEQHVYSVKDWLPSTGDFPDAVLAASAIKQGIAQILSDDMDLVSFNGITLYTANQKAIDAARAAGRLI